MFSIDDLWEILKVIQGKEGDLTDALKALAKSEGANSETFFRNVLDQIAFYSDDSIRLRNFIRDWYASLRTIGTFQTTVSDIYSVPNDQLDELFRSFGYQYSASIRFPQSNNTPTEKANFFLDLVNLYKVKGTPQGMLDVLQYYGIGELSLYEFFLQYDNRAGKNPNDLVFRGDIAATSSNNRSGIHFGYDVLTINDPHWLYTEDKIKQLNTTTKLNLPSRTPYFAVQPIFDESTVMVSMAILVRKIQDFYETWRLTGTLPPDDANCTATGESVSILELYLACLYFFDKEWNVPGICDNFICYDGVLTDIEDIMAQYEYFSTTRPATRAELIKRVNDFNELFSREGPRNFLQSQTDAETLLGQINPDFKINLDNLTDRYTVTLSSLLNDLGDWMKYNLSYGFININYFSFGLDALFSKLKQVITFFKPYHARIVPVEAVAFRNRSFNTIIVEDVFGAIDVEHDLNDFVTGDGKPCCAGFVTECPDAGIATPYYSRDLYDCGSYFDIGAATDIRDNLYIDPLTDVNDPIFCSTNIDSTSNVQMYVLGDDPEVVLDEDAYVDSTLFGYWQFGGKVQNFDEEGIFDCAGNDFLELTVESTFASLSSSSSSSFFEEAPPT